MPTFLGSGKAVTHRLMCCYTLKSVVPSYMSYADFLIALGKAGLSVRAFAELVGMNPNSITNYARNAELPSHLALIAVLIVRVSELGGDYRQAMATVGLTPKKPRGAARQGHFGGDPQNTLDLGR